MDNTPKVTSIHLLFAIIAAVLSTAFTLNWFGFRNDGIAALIGFVLLYIAGQISNRIVGDDEEMKGLKKWLWNGILPFIFLWFMIWVILYNYLGPFPH